MQAVDFAHVPAEQAEIHARLDNWAKWCKPGHGSTVHPMFRMFRHSSKEAKHREVTPINIVDSRDATVIQKVMPHLPEKHRVALAWWYVLGGNPIRVCQALGVSKQHLAELVVQARTMVRNRLR